MGLIDYAVICPKAPVLGAVVVIDPFSSGANLAAMVLNWGYKLLLVFSEKDSPVAKLVSVVEHYQLLTTLPYYVLKFRTQFQS